MLTQEEAVEVRVMARQGKGIREIARDLGVSRNTVRRYLRGAQAQYTPRPKRPTKLAPYEDYVRARLAAAQPDVIPATVLLRELAEQGYTGGISQLRRSWPRCVVPPPIRWCALRRRRASRCRRISPR